MNQLGILLARLGRFEEAQQAHLEAIAVSERRLEHDPGRPALRQEMARAHGRIEMRARNPAECIDGDGQGQAVRERDADDAGAGADGGGAAENGSDPGEAQKKCSQEFREKSLLNFHGRSVTDACPAVKR